MKTQTLTLPPDPVDHYAAVEAKRIEMIQEAHGKIDALKARVADLRQQAQAKRAERIKLGEAGNYSHMIRLQTESEGLDREARRLLNIELPQLEHDRMHVDSHPTMVALRISADSRAAADKQKNAVPQKLPTFVVLDADFGWTHESRPTIFAKGQVVRDLAHIAKLIEYGAPLVR
jgi:hypothetical protein